MDFFASSSIAVIASRVRAELSLWEIFRERQSFVSDGRFIINLSCIVKTIFICCLHQFYFKSELALRTLVTYWWLIDTCNEFISTNQSLFILHSRLGSSANPFFHRPFPLLPD